jgi:hypothetical protein
MTRQEQLTHLEMLLLVQVMQQVQVRHWCCPLWWLGVWMH